MPSLVTSVIGGFVGSGAAKSAAKTQSAGYDAAGKTIGDARDKANTTLGDAASTAGTNAVNAAGDAIGGVRDATGRAIDRVTGAAKTAGEGVTSAAVDANSRLDPYAATGAAASKTLGDLTGPDGALMHNFGTADMQGDDGYKFRLQQGQQALERSAAAHGSVMGGGILKSLTDYSQGAASQEYQSAFDRFQKTNQDRFSNLDQLSREGQSAAGKQGDNTVDASKYTGNINTDAGKYAGTADMTGAKTEGDYWTHANEYSGDQTMLAGRGIAADDMTAGKEIGDTQIGSAGAIADGTLGSAAAWNGALSGIGTALNSAVAGGYGGAGGFSLKGAVTGVPRK